jgi:hypothetical protein
MSAQQVKTCCVHKLPPCDNNSFTSKELEELHHDTVVRANHEAAFEPNKSGLKGKPHVFESWSDFIIIFD